MIDRLSPTRRPDERAIGYQTWTNLLFAHWRVPVSLLRPLLPMKLEIDTFDGDAWLGLVPFQMSGVRPAWFPAIPGVSRFPETNLRTYVHLNGVKPGVWFFSLDADCWLAVEVARWRWHLNYFHSAMSVTRNGHHLRYQSRRADKRSRHSADVDIEAMIGDSYPMPVVPAAASSKRDEIKKQNEISPTERSHNQADGSISPPDTFEHFLFERYFLYATGRDGALYRGQVHHRPYPVKSAQLSHFQQTISQASELPMANRPDHVAFSEGVTVEIFPLRRCH